MSKMVYAELDTSGKVPLEVVDRICKALDGRKIDCSDIPELTKAELSEFAPCNEHRAGTPLAVTLNADTANTLRAQAKAKQKTPAA